MLRQIIWISSIVFLLSGCAYFVQPESNTNRLKKIKQGRIYFLPYEKVWRAAQLVIKYPLLVSNMDTGQIETDYIKSIEGFKEPELKKDPPTGMRYKIRVTLVKGRTQGRESVKVTVFKLLENQKDFFSQPIALESDGLEEKVIYYRIDREIAIEEGIARLAN